MNGHICPECGTDRGAASEDGRPGCGCAEWAAEAARAERSAEAAAADFHPLRIRPYVTFEGPDSPHAPAAPGMPGAHDGYASLPPSPSAQPYAEGEPDGGAATMTLGVVRGPESGAGEGREYRSGSVSGSDFDSGSGSDSGFGNGYELDFERGSAAPLPEQRRGPAVWLAVGAAAVAVVGIAAFAGGLFSEADERDRALPDMVTGAPSVSDAPEASASRTGAGSPSALPSASASASASASGSASASASVSASASPAVAGASAVGALPGSSKSAAPTAAVSASTVRATDAVEQSPEPAAGTVLSRGARGPEVTELQDRLAQVWLYNGPRNGRFNERVEEAVRTYQSYKSIEGDPEGTYGPHTRRALEAETQEP
ncbi:hypothetical protein BGM19_13215 [Streptomyces agglomeratus]|uniref:Peptidoglycan binding-like domain-containing protein n=1 Tax=Streptomyces agglomeratus TaxID=285458 RepID=A0A1E5PC09_9ACTN|nr:peptidoglycan-binding domain-containing protein [Streptomyces agglomeratus]OEJ27069.1 hypothetical protein AS594_23895 [Streptomyces agglomeratus]OEJ51410.1 hypothetical protein BGK72_12115 [Streptomyces agglomeratus]OEJ58811.1 hypothetical protein BGM19_13215 [Streptomyces agglomeratus]